MRCCGRCCSSSIRRARTPPRQVPLMSPGSLRRLTPSAGRGVMAHTFVLVHGAWHGGWCWRRVADRLRHDGHALTGLGERSHLLEPGIDLATHVADVVNLMQSERLSEVVLCGHSYGGFVISGVAEQMS